MKKAAYLLLLAIFFSGCAALQNANQRAAERNANQRAAIAAEREQRAAANRSTNQGRTATATDREVRELLEFANRYIGVRHVRGGTTAQGFDCSGFVQYVFRHFGHTLPRTSAEQARVGREINRRNLRAGDLVFFQGRDISSRAVGHVGIITQVGSGGQFYFIHVASNGVRIDTSELHYFKIRYVTARRIIGQ